MTICISSREVSCSRYLSSSQWGDSQDKFFRFGDKPSLNVCASQTVCTQIHQCVITHVLIPCIFRSTVKDHCGPLQSSRGFPSMFLDAAAAAYPSTLCDVLARAHTLACCGQERVPQPPEAVARTAAATAPPRRAPPSLLRGGKRLPVRLCPRSPGGVDDAAVPLSSAVKAAWFSWMNWRSQVACGRNRMP